MDDEEIWKPIPGYEPYEASSLGRIRGPQGMRKPVPRSRPGYDAPELYVDLFLSGERYTCAIKKLVAAVFLGPCPLGHYVKFRNGLEHDTRVENLYYHAPKRRSYAWGEQMRDKRRREAQG